MPEGNLAILLFLGTRQLGHFVPFVVEQIMKDNDIL